ncbi:MAG: AAA family ATPase [Actinomycetota bacterium]
MPERVSPTVIVASDDLTLLDEIVRHLEEIPHWRLVASARSAAELTERLRESTADAVLITDGPAAELAATADRALAAARVVVLAREETVGALRAAVDLGARGFVSWPRERKRLRLLVEEGLGVPRRGSQSRGRLSMLWSPKGGSGTSVLASHLAAAVAATGTKCVLVDLDLDHGDQSAILGADPESKTILDLVRVADEMSPSVLESVAWSHASGFGAVLSPGSPGEAELLKASDVAGVLEAIRDLTDQVVVDMPSGLTDVTFAVAEIAERILLITTPDVLSLRRGRDAMAALRAAGIDDQRIEIVLNRSGGDITARDVEAVLTRPVAAQVRPDIGLLKAPDRAELAASGIGLLTDLARSIAGLPASSRRRRFRR